MPNIQLADNLRYLRKKNGLNQDNMKQILNISRQAYSNYERCERTPDLDTLVRLSRLYNVSIDDLILKNLRTSPSSFYGVRESEALYPIFAECKETGNSVYLSGEEMSLITSLRSQPEETRQVITGFLEHARRE